MAGSYLNIISFLITTVFYYLSLKPTIEPSTLSDKNSPAYTNYKGDQYLYLGIYFLLVMLVQFIVNTTIITSNCGGNISDNIGFAGFITFIPWTLIFGVILLVLLVYPGFKSAFSDVIGYFYVSSSANKVLTELLLNKDLENSLDTNTGSGLQDNSIPVSSVITGSLEPTDGDKLPSAPMLQQGGALGKKELEKAVTAFKKTFK